MNIVINVNTENNLLKAKRLLGLYQNSMTNMAIDYAW